MTETPVELSQSELATFRDCPLKHAWEHKDLWKKPTAPGGALNRGTFVHHVLEHYYLLRQRGRDHEYSVKTAMGCVNSYEDTDEDERELVRWVCEGYFEHYGDEADQWEVLACEYRFRVNLPDQDGNATKFWLNGSIDLVVKNRQTGLVWIWDHKTAANLERSQDLELADQWGLYTWALRQLGKQVVGSYYNGLSTTRLKSKEKPLADRFKREPLNRGEVELQNIALDAYYTALAAYSGAPVYSSPNPQQCGWKCGYKEVHLITRSGYPVTDAMEDYGFSRGDARYLTPGQA